ncbi:hypothetical protein D3C71_1640240 [compost metagenome]
MADEGGGKDKGAALARQYGGDLVLGPHKGAGEVGIQGFMPLGQCHLLHAARRARGAGVVEGNIEPPETPHGQLHQGAGVRFAFHIPRETHRLAPEFPDLFHQGIQLGLAAGPQHDAGPLPCKQNGAGAADAGAGSRDDGDLVGQL